MKKGGKLHLKKVLDTVLINIVRNLDKQVHLTGSLEGVVENDGPFRDVRVRGQILLKAHYFEIIFYLKPHFLHCCSNHLFHLV